MMKQTIPYALAFAICAFALPATSFAGKVKVRNCSSKNFAMVYSYNASDNPKSDVARDKKKANKNGDRIVVKCSAAEKKCSIKVVFQNPGNTNKWTYYKRNINGNWLFRPGNRVVLSRGSSCN